jgi:hypothetical protein
MEEVRYKPPNPVKNRLRADLPFAFSLSHSLPQDTSLPNDRYGDMEENSVKP